MTTPLDKTAYLPGCNHPVIWKYFEHGEQIELYAAEIDLWCSLPTLDVFKKYGSAPGFFSINSYRVRDRPWVWSPGLNHRNTTGKAIFSKYFPSAVPNSIALEEIKLYFERGGVVMYRTSGIDPEKELVRPDDKSEPFWAEDNFYYSLANPTKFRYDPRLSRPKMPSPVFSALAESSKITGVSAQLLLDF